MMKLPWLASNFHGCMSRPMKQVITAPVWMLIRDGQRFEKSLAGATTLAATFTLSVATSSASMATITANRLPRWLRTMTGFQIGSLKMTTVADVTAMAMNEYRVIANGKLSA